MTDADGLPILAEMQRPAPIQASPGAGVAPPSFVPAGGFVALAGKSTRSIRPQPRYAFALWRWAAGALIELHAALTVLIAILAIDRHFLVRAIDRGEVSRREAELSDELIERLGVAWAMLSILVGGAVLVWSIATVHRASRRYPMGRHYPILTALCWFIPIAWMWMPWTRLRRASQCEDGGTADGLQAWQLLFLLHNLLLIAGSGVMAVYEETDPMQMTVIAVVWSLLAISQVATCFVAVKAMYQTDRATSGTLYSDFIVPQPATA